MEGEDKKLSRFLVIILVIALLGIVYMAWVFSDSPDPSVPLETLEDIFIDVDGDGDLDFVHSVQFVRQQNEEVEVNPTPAQPGQ